MELKGNKGEWSELYAFFKLLGDGILYCGDGELNRYDDKFYPILEVFRSDAPERTSYKVQVAKKNILVAGKTLNIEIPQGRFKDEAQTLLNNIKSISSDKRVDFSYLESFMNEIGEKNVKAKSSDKADIRIVVHDLKTGSKPEAGYSIKSRLGGASTLINSNKDASNFVYKVEGITEEQIAKFNTFRLFRDKFSFLKSVGAKVSFHSTCNETLHRNLILLDMGLEQIVADALLDYYSGNGRNLTDVISHVAKADPLQIGGEDNTMLYAYKVKQFLLAFALGMTVSTPWNGKFNANGGYIIVKEDGDIVCFHFFDRNDLEDYLYNNTFFETPSTSRHLFGDIYKVGEDCFVKLNLQVRFK